MDFCHANGVPVEAELGAIRGKEDDHVSEADCKTDPDQVAEFVERTGCDLLAVSIGNVHGLEDTPKIDLEHLAKIAAVSPCPLVLHGGSGIPYETNLAKVLMDARAAVTEVAKKTQLAINGMPY